jgi:hypothetical protein
VKEIIVSIFVVLIAALTLCSCTSSTTQPATSAVTTSTATSTSPKTPASSAASTKTTASTTKPTGTLLRLKTVKFTDIQGTGTEAFQLLIPSDWQFQANIQWVLDNPGMPASSNLRAWNPAGSEEFDVFPNQSFFYSTNPSLVEMFPVGSKYFGMEVLQPLSPQDALGQIVLPRFMGSIGNFKVISQGPIDSLETANTDPSSGISGSSAGAKIRIEYAEKGVAMEAEIYCMVESITFPIRTMAGMKNNTNWYVDHIAAFKAKKGQLDANTKLFQAIAYSLKLNPVWFSKYNQVVAFLIQNQIQQIQSMGQLSKIISQTNDQITEEMAQSYNDRQAVDDKVTQDFSNYIRGVDEYYDPVAGKSVELPTGYQNAWTNSNGDYVVSDSPTYNPNVGSNLNWQSMNKK